MPKGISKKDVKKAIKTRFETEAKLRHSESFLQNIKRTMKDKERLDKKIRKAIESAKNKLPNSVVKSQMIINNDQIISNVPDKNNDFISKTEGYITAFERYTHGDWIKFLEEELNNYELFLVIENENAPEEIKNKAFEVFLKQNPDKNDLNLIISFSPVKWRKKAEEALKKLSQQ